MKSEGTKSHTWRYLVAGLAGIAFGVILIRSIARELRIFLGRMKLIIQDLY